MGIYFSYWGILSSDGIPLRGCRLFFFFFPVFSTAFLVFQWPTQREGNTGFRWYSSPKSVSNHNSLPWLPATDS